MTKSKIFFVSCIAFVAGIAAGQGVNVSYAILLAFFVCAVCFAVVFRAQKLFVVAAFCVAALAFGIWRHDTADRAFRHNELMPFADTRETVEFMATVVQEPEQGDSATRLVVAPDFVQKGRVLLFLRQENHIQYGDQIHVTGRLQSPGELEGFQYDAFLAKDSVYALMYQPKVVSFGKDDSLGTVGKGMRLLLQLKDKTRETLHTHISLPESAILAAILLGDKGLLSEATGEKLNIAGVRHITAISGMHVAVLTIYLMPIFVWLGFWRQQAFYITVALMLLYVVFTGLQPSATRAAVMGGMFLLGQHLGRPSGSYRALVIAASGMLLVNPFLLFYDVGFQLSFLAVLGIIMFVPTLVSLIPKFPVRELVAMSIAAQIFTLPILLHNFGLFSVVSVFANILVVPTLPFLMGFGFLFLVGGFFGHTIGFLLSLPVSLLLQYISLVVDFFANVPFAALTTENTPVFWLALLYAGIALFYWKFRKRQGFLVQ